MHTASPLTAPLPEAPWGAMIGIYLVVVGLPSGLGLLTWWWICQDAALTGWFERRAHLVALTALGFVSVLLVVDLGRPGGFYLMLTKFDNLASPMSVGAKLVAVKMALLGLAIYAAERGRRRVGAATPAAGGDSAPPTDHPLTSSPFGATLQPLTRALLVAVSFALAIYPAALLSRTWSSPLAGTSGAGLLFLSTSLLLGAVAAVAIIAISASPHRPFTDSSQALARRLLLTLLVGHAIAVLFQALAVSGDPRHGETVAAIATGGYAMPWWIGVVTAGIALPILALVLFPRQRSALLLAALGAAVGAGTARYLLFAAGG